MKKPDGFANIQSNFEINTDWKRNKLKKNKYYEY